VIEKPRIASLNSGTIVFKDSTTLTSADTLLLATGYDLRVPFLTAGGVLEEVQELEPQPADRLTTNMRRVHPLYEHTLSLDASYPLGALHFNGLLLYNPTGMTDYAQALFTAYTLANPTLLETRETLFALLTARENRLHEAGFIPTHYGHKIVHGYGPLFGHGANGSFQDLLVDYLRDRGLAGYPGIPPLGTNFTEPWRVYVLRHGLDMLLAWNAGEDREGVRAWNERWVRGRRTEEDYLQMMYAVVEWWEKEKDVVNLDEVTWRA
jgi:hypothetical protein